MAETQKKHATGKELRKRFFDLFDTSTGQGEQAYTDKSVSLGLTKEYSTSELNIMTNRQFVTPSNNKRADLTSVTQVVDAIGQPHREIVNNIADAERLKALDPNIKRVEQIVVSSIMSPNDLQDVDPEIVIESDEIPDVQKTKISELLTKFYCDTYNLRKKMTNWVKEAHFRSGAGVAMILPEATLTEIINKYDPQRVFLRQRASESLIKHAEEKKLSPEETTYLKSVIFSDQFYQNVLEHQEFTEVPKEFLPAAGAEGIKVGLRQSPLQSEDTTEKLDAADQEMIERIFKDLISLDPPDFHVTDPIRSDLRQGVESIALNFNKALSGKGSGLHISENAEVLRFGRAFRKNQKDKLTSKISPIFAQLDATNEEKDEDFYAYRDLPIMDLSGHMTDFSEQQTYPFYMDLPTEAVIPVCVPGTKDQHLGYFILTDAYGQPIEASAYLIDAPGNTISGRINTAYQAMYGEMPTNSGIYGAPGAGYGLTTMKAADYKKNSINKIFNYVLDEMLKRKLGDMGLNDVTLGRYNTIAQCMLYRLLEKKQTSLVFVPEKYITYLAFDYHRADGTGKSRIEDIIYMESLKVSFLTANTMATMKSAVPVKKLKLTCDEKQINTTALAWEVRNAVVQKEKFSPTTYPATVANQILSQNLSIDLTHPNSQGFSYTVEDTHREIPKADTAFLEQLDNATIIGLGVAPSALSESSEVQFARSLATTNLHYAKSIRQDQVVVEETTTTHVQNHLALSSALIYKIGTILNSVDDHEGQELERTAPKKDLTEIKPSSDDKLTAVGLISQKIDSKTFAKVLKVISNVQVKLCPPNVAPDDTQYTILGDQIKRIGEYVDAIYPDDYSNFGDEKVSNHYRLVKAHMKSILCKEAAEQLGFSGLMTQVPDITTYSLEHLKDLTKLYGVMKNISESLTREVQAREKKAPEDAPVDDTSEDTSSTPKSFW